MMSAMLSILFQIVYVLTFMSLVFLLWRRFVWRRPLQFGEQDPKVSYKIDVEEIVPLVEFDWKNEEPIQHRPYKSKFYMSMGQSLQHCSRSVSLTQPPFR